MKVSSRANRVRHDDSTFDHTRAEECDGEWDPSLKLNWHCLQLTFALDAPVRRMQRLRIDVVYGDSVQPVKGDHFCEIAYERFGSSPVLLLVFSSPHPISDTS